jgi:hypothetical protein
MGLSAVASSPSRILTRDEVFTVRAPVRALDRGNCSSETEKSQPGPLSGLLEEPYPNLKLALICLPSVQLEFATTAVHRDQETGGKQWRQAGGRDLDAVRAVSGAADHLERGRADGWERLRVGRRGIRCCLRSGPCRRRACPIGTGVDGDPFADPGEPLTRLSAARFGEKASADRHLYV